LAIPHTRLLLTWMTLDALIWIPRMSLFLDAERRWLPDQWFTVAVVVRGLMVILLCAVVVWQIWHPGADLLRRGNDGRLYEEPAGEGRCRGDLSPRAGALPISERSRSDRNRSGLSRVQGTMNPTQLSAPEDLSDWLAAGDRAAELSAESVAVDAQWWSEALAE